MSKRLLIVDTFAEYLLDFALRCQDWGWTVKWFSDPTDKRAPLVGEGLVERVKDFDPWMMWADFVFVGDNTKYLARLDQWRRKGVPIVGPSQDASAWELDRKLGMEVLRKAGIPCPPYKEFTDYDAAIAYVKKQDNAFVSKPCGVETDKSLSYVAPSPEALVYMLTRWKRQQKLKGSFILQEKIDGIEFAVGGWYGPGGFNEGFEENWEHKPLFAGDLGPSTGEQGTVIRMTKKSKLADLVLKPIEPALEKLGYVGCTDVNCIVDANGKPWPLEFTNRPGVPAFSIQIALLKSDPAQWLADLAAGVDSSVWDYDNVAVGTVMAIPDYPYSKATAKEVVGIPVYGVTARNRDNLHPAMIQLGHAPQRVNGTLVDMPIWTTAGDYVLIATGVAPTVQAARNKVNDILDDLKKMPASPFWRRDIGTRLRKQLPILQAQGYALGLNFSEQT